MAAAQALRHDRVDVAALARTTRSSNAVVECGWTVDMDTVTCDVTDVHQLDRYPLEHIFAMPEKSRLLLLVSVRDDDSFFEDLDQAVNSVQNNGRITLS